jgi:homoserine dehydrogenase
MSHRPGRALPALKVALLGCGVVGSQVAREFPMEKEGSAMSALGQPPVSLLRL